MNILSNIVTFIEMFIILPGFLCTILGYLLVWLIVPYIVYCIKIIGGMKNDENRNVFFGVVVMVLPFICYKLYPIIIDMPIEISKYGHTIDSMALIGLMYMTSFFLSYKYFTRKHVPKVTLK